MDDYQANHTPTPGPCHPHLVHAGQHHSNLPIGIRGDGGEGIPHNGEKGLAPCHHLFNERKVTPLALSCNHSDDDIEFHMCNTGSFSHTR